MDVLIITVARHPLEARLSRQTRALVDAGRHVRLAAPWTAFAATPPRGVTAIDLPRAEAGDRLAAARQARTYLQQHAHTAGAVLVCDAELVPAAIATCADRAVWDVRSTAAASLDGGWRWHPGRLAARTAWRALQRAAEGRIRVMLADEASTAGFARAHPVIPDLPWVPDAPSAPDQRRVVHLGGLSRAEGASMILALAGSLADDVTVEVIGDADAEVRPLLRAAAAEGALSWTPFPGHDAALTRLDGACAGLALAVRATRRRAPPAILEYMARGVPTVATATAPARELLQPTGAGLVVRADDLAAVRRGVQWLLAHDQARRDIGAAAYATARAAYDWAPHGERFAALLAEVPDGGPSWPS